MITQTQEYIIAANNRRIVYFNTFISLFPISNALCIKVLLYSTHSSRTSLLSGGRAAVPCCWLHLWAFSFPLYHMDYDSNYLSFTFDADWTLVPLCANVNWSRLSISTRRRPFQRVQPWIDSSRCPSNSYAIQTHTLTHTRIHLYYSYNKHTMSKI